MLIDAPVRAVRGNTLPVYRGVNYTGKTFGAWTVLGPMRCQRPEGNSTYKTSWFCQCSCGASPQWKDKNHLVRGLSTGCMQCYGTRNSGHNNGNWKGHGEVTGEAYNKVRFGAKVRGIQLELSVSDLNALWISQNRVCALTGITLVMGDTASLDRIDSLKSYCTGNVQWVHKTVNIMKNDFPEHIFIEMCRAVSKYKGIL